MRAFTYLLKFFVVRNAYMRFYYVLYEIYDVVLSFCQRRYFFVLPLRPCPLRGLSIVHTEEGSALILCTKTEADCSIHSKVIKGGSRNLEIRSRDPGHANLVI